MARCGRRLTGLWLGLLVLPVQVLQAAPPSQPSAELLLFIAGFADADGELADPEFLESLDRRTQDDDPAPATPDPAAVQPDSDDDRDDAPDHRPD